MNLGKNTFYFLRERISRLKILPAIFQLQRKLPTAARSDELHLHQSVNWIKKAQDATQTGGVSRGFSLTWERKFKKIGWQPSYPETTGYIIPTILRYAKKYNVPALSQRARLMGDWEISIMLPSGGIPGGNSSRLFPPAIFDTGQVIRGLTALWQETREEKYRFYALRAAEWILAAEYNSAGRWLNYNAVSVDPTTCTYNVYAIAPVLALGILTNRRDLVELSRRVADFTIKQQNKNGWFAHCDFTERNDELVHTLAYAIDGLWDIGWLLKDQKILSAAKKALDGVISSQRDNGEIPGRLYPDWHSDVDWTCLTGVAQIGVTSLKAYKYYQDTSYLDSVHKGKEFLKKCQNLTDEKNGGLGALWGSWPINGEYQAYQALNWAVKFFIDLILDIEDLRA